MQPNTELKPPTVEKFVEIASQLNDVNRWDVLTYSKLVIFCNGRGFKVSPQEYEAIPTTAKIALRELLNEFVK